MKIPPETVAAGLLIPEGPVALSEDRCCWSRWRPEGSTAP